MDYKGPFFPLYYYARFTDTGLVGPPANHSQDTLTHVQT